MPSLAQDLNEKLTYIRNNGAERIELIGHCMGAHIAGQAAKIFKENMEEDIDTIIGNDYSHEPLKTTFN